MTEVVATAPGKLILIGEYAVLEGAPAIVMAIDRRAKATVIRPAGKNLVTAPEIHNGDVEFTVDPQRIVSWLGVDPSTEVRLELLSQVLTRFWPDTPVQIETDTSAFFEDGIKMGFGSSAALTVAASAALCGGTPDLATLVEVHRAAQGGHGSGFDVAASLCGGTIVYRARPAGASQSVNDAAGAQPFGEQNHFPSRLGGQQSRSPSAAGRQQNHSPSRLGGQQGRSPSASGRQQNHSPSPPGRQQNHSPSPPGRQQNHSPSPPGRGSGGGENHPPLAPTAIPISLPAGLHMRCIWTGLAASTPGFLRGLDALGRRRAAIDALIESAESQVADLDDSAASWVMAVRKFSQALKCFADQTALPIYGGGHAEVAGIADKSGVAYKPSGAGGGDLGIAVSDDSSAMQSFTRALSQTSVTVLRVGVDPLGLAVA